MRKADICLVCQGMNGGVRTSLLNLYKGMKEKGYVVDLVCRDMELQFLGDLSRESDLHTLESLDYRKGLSDFTRYLGTNRPEVIITPQLRPTITALRARAALGSDTRIYPVIHNAYSRELKTLSFKKWVSRILRIRYYYPKCDGIISVSAGAAEDFAKLIGINKNAVTVIYNPIDTHAILDKSSQPLDHPWFRMGEPPVILGIGRLVKQKNFKLLLDAFDIFRSRVPSRLMILGEGPERKNLENRIKGSPYSNDIYMPGFVANPYTYLKRSALLILSSDFEGLPNVVLEALATGTPVVSTDCPSGPREILMDGKYGAIVPVNDPVKLAEAVTATLDAPVSGEELQARAGVFDLHSSAENYLKYTGLKNEIELSEELNPADTYALDVI